MKSKHKKLSNKQKRDYMFCYAMISIAVMNFIVFYIMRNGSAILMAFQQVDYFDKEGFVHYKWGLDNFHHFFQELRNPDSEIYVAIINTLKYFAVNTFVVFPISYFISYFLYKKIWGYKFFRVVFFLTTIVSSVVLVTIFKNLIRGPIPKIIEMIFEYEMPTLLMNEKTATATIIVYSVWTGLAGNFILFQGAMNRIPEDIHDALRVDGCGWLRELICIITPMCWQTVSTLLVMNMVGLFNSSGPILLFNTGGRFGTWTLSYWIYEQVMGSNYSYPAAIGLLLSVITLPLVLIVRKLLSKPFADLEY